MNAPTYRRSALVSSHEPAALSAFPGLGRLKASPSPPPAAPVSPKHNARETPNEILSIAATSSPLELTGSHTPAKTPIEMTYDRPHGNVPAAAADNDRSSGSYHGDGKPDAWLECIWFVCGDNHFLIGRRRFDNKYTLQDRTWTATPHWPMAQRRNGGCLARSSLFISAMPKRPAASEATATPKENAPFPHEKKRMTPAIPRTTPTAVRALQRLTHSRASCCRGESSFGSSLDGVGSAM